MATTLIDTRRPILAQIEKSWDEWIKTDAGLKLIGSGSICQTASKFNKGETPWTTKQSVLERNTVHANKLIRLYIELGIEVEERWPVWKFFEVAASGVVNWVKDQIKLLKRIQKVLKLERELEVHEPLPDATSLFTHTGNLSLDEIEDDFKVKVKEAKKAAKKAAKAEIAKAKKAAKAMAKAAAKEAKKLAAVEAKAAKVAAAKNHKRLVQFVKKANEYIRWCRANNLNHTMMVGMIEFCEPDQLYEVPTQSQGTLGRVPHQY